MRAEGSSPRTGNSNFGDCRSTARPISRGHSARVATRAEDHVLVLPVASSAWTLRPTCTVRRPGAISSGWTSAVSFAPYAVVIVLVLRISRAMMADPLSITSRANGAASEDPARDAPVQNAARGQRVSRSASRSRTHGARPLSLDANASAPNQRNANSPSLRSRTSAGAGRMSHWKAKRDSCREK